MSLLSNEWKNLRHIILYGCGAVGKECLEKMKTDFCIDYIIDKNAEQLKEIITDILVYAPEEGIASLAGQRVIVMTGGKVYFEIGKFLKSKGLVEFKDYCSIEYFITNWYWEEKSLNCVMELHTALTMDCTLKCKNCNMFVPFYKSSVNYDLGCLKKESDLLFKYVDYLFCYTLLGGEPFLHKHLGEFVQYIAEKYRDKVGLIKIITNGTIAPKKETLDILKKYNVWVSVSDYTSAVSYKKKFDEVCSGFIKNGIDCSVKNLGKWLAFGFPKQPINIDESLCAAHMRECSPKFHGYNDGKVFFCHVAWSAEKMGGYVLQDKDFVDLRRLNVSDRHVIAEHCSGNVEDGYVSFCRLCGGCGKDNHCEVLAGEQV